MRMHFQTLEGVCKLQMGASAHLARPLALVLNAHQAVQAAEGAARARAVMVCFS